MGAILWSILIVVAAIHHCLTEGVIPQDVSLTSNLIEGNRAYDTQTVTFRCITRGPGTILSWISENYIGSGDATLEFASVHNPGRTEVSSTNPATTATLISATTDPVTGVTEIISELNIIASLQYPRSSVSCRVNGDGTRNTTIFRVMSQHVSLTSNLIEGNRAYDTQIVTFRCITRGPGTILSWISENYIGSGDATLEFASVHNSGRIEVSSTNPATTATLISTTTDPVTGVTEIISELNITASLQHPTSSVSCRIKGGGALNTTVTTFQTILKPTIIPTTSLMVETESISDNDSSNAVTVIGTLSTQDTVNRWSAISLAVGAGTSLGCIIIITVIIVIIVITIQKSSSRLPMKGAKQVSTSGSTDNIIDP